MAIEIKNAVIEKVFLGYEGHGVLTFNLILNYGGVIQCFGGYSLWCEKETKQAVFGVDCIVNVLRVVGVNDWDSLVGKSVRVKTDGMIGMIQSIGNYLKDDWFTPKELAKKYWKE